MSLKPAPVPSPSILTLRPTLFRIVIAGIVNNSTTVLVDISQIEIRHQCRLGANGLFAIQNGLGHHGHCAVLPLLDFWILVQR